MKQKILWDGTQVPEKIYNEIWKNLVSIRNMSYGKPDIVLSGIANSKGIISENLRENFSTEDIQHLINIGWVNEDTFAVDALVFRIVTLGYNTSTRETKEPIKDGLYSSYERAWTIPNYMPTSGITEDD